jgi:hypothetical protein
MQQRVKVPKPRRCSLSSKKKKIGAKTLSPKKKEKSQNRRKHAPAHALLLGGMRRFVSRVDSLLAASSVSCSAARC